LENKVYEIKQKNSVDGPQIHLVNKFDETVYVRPTFIQTNEFTWPFQEIVNTYSIP